MANECKMEFYFKRADIEKLLAKNPKAKGIIISRRLFERIVPQITVCQP